MTPRGILSTLFGVLAAILLVLQLGTAYSDESAVQKANQYLVNATKTVNSINTYHAIMEATERHNGGFKGVEKIECYFVKNPFKIYFKWLPGSLYEGLQASHVLPRDGNQHFLARPTGVAGLAGTQKLELKAGVIRKLYPHHFKINEYHLGFLLQVAINARNKAQSAGTMQASDLGMNNSLVPGKSLHLMEVVLSEKPMAGLDFARLRLGFDQKTSLPFFIESYDFNGQVYARYRVLSIEPNVKINDSVFDI